MYKFERDKAKGTPPTQEEIDYLDETEDLVFEMDDISLEETSLKTDEPKNKLPKQKYPLGDFFETRKEFRTPESKTSKNISIKFV